jgi:molybdopterin-synthase adenylyltransferase
MALTEPQIRRYARHILLEEIGGRGQEALIGSRVLVVGAGGLGSPLLLYLAAAGVGTLGIVDDDVVDETNLQRQIVHASGAVGRRKVESAAETLAHVNPAVRVETHPVRLSADNALAIIGDYDIVADGSDNFPTRFLVNDACFLARRTLVSAAVLRFDGQLATYKAFIEDRAGAHGPCYRCLFRAPPPPGTVPTCAEAGVLGAFCGLMGAMQATEVVKELLGIGDSLSGHLIIFDALGATQRKIRVAADPGCPLCGGQPTITSLAGHADDANVCA